MVHHWSGKILGQYILWKMSSKTLTVSDVKTALREADLPEEACLALSYGNAFSRACRKLARERVIRSLKAEKDTITFQFNKQEKGGEVFSFPLEALVTLDKSTGKVSCSESPELEAIAQSKLDEAVVLRNGSDITNLIKRLFRDNSELCKSEECPGGFFVPAEYLSFVDKVASFIKSLNGHLTQIPVPDDESHGTRLASTAVKDHIAAMIEEHLSAIEGWDGSTREGTIDRRIDKIRETREKIAAYSEYLKDQGEKLLSKLDEAGELLRSRVEMLHRAETGAAVPAEAGAA